jgi:alpha-beta hydrolase superfamily lysophospholipase
MKCLLFASAILCLFVRVSMRSIDDLENEIVAHARMNSCWVELGGWKVHYLRSRPCMHPANRTIVLVHGMSTSSALAWSSAGPLLAENEDIIGLDLPGFGRSTMPQGVIEADFQLVMVELCSLFERFVNHLGLVQVSRETPDSLCT